VAGEAPALTVLIAAAVIDSWCLQLHGSRAERELARLGLAVAHHQRVALLVALAAMALDVSVGFRLERLNQHPQRSPARDLIQQQNFLTRFPLIPLLDYLQHRWRPPSNPAPTGVCVGYAEGYAAFFMPSRSTTFGNSSEQRHLSSS
jgi:hypothetical protein